MSAISFNGPICPATASLRKNSSLESLIKAIRQDEASWWAAHQTWHQRWLSGDLPAGRSPGDVLDMKARTGAIGAALQLIADQLERIKG
jgi:hypothetical protein